MTPEQSSAPSGKSLAPSPVTADGPTETSTGPLFCSQIGIVGSAAATRTSGHHTLDADVTTLRVAATPMRISPKSEVDPPSQCCTKVIASEINPFGPWLIERMSKLPDVVLSLGHHR